MEQRPDSPNPTKPEFPLVDDELDSEIVHHVSQRKKRRKGVGGEGMELQLTSMIDVIFQLLIYFIITANFMIDEGTILASLPGNAAPPTEEPPPDVVPIKINMLSSNDGVTYKLEIDEGMGVSRKEVNNVSELYAYFNDRVGSDMKADDPVQINPQNDVRWQHVVNVFNACVRAELESVGFAPAQGGG